MNKSGLQPRGRAILVEPYEPELRSTVIALPDSVKERLTTLENRVIVIEIGPEAWADEKAPRAAVGERVMISKFSGVMVVGTKDGRQYRLINDRDLFCAIEVD